MARAYPRGCLACLLRAFGTGIVSIRDPRHRCLVLTESAATVHFLENRRASVHSRLNSKTLKYQTCQYNVDVLFR